MLEKSEKFRDTIPKNSGKFRDTNPVISEKTGNRRKRTVKHHTDSDRNFRKPIPFSKIPLPMNPIEKFRNPFPEYRKIPKPFSSLRLREGLKKMNNYLEEEETSGTK
jgi:hypothetical protein